MDEKIKVKQAINAFYKGAGIDVTFKGDVNTKVAEIFGEMVVKTQKCTDVLNWVPKPTGGKATVSWIAQNFTKSVMGKLSSKQSLTCAKTVIWAYTRKLQMAAAGV